MRELARSSGVDLGADLTTARKGLYCRFLEYCLNDYALSADESPWVANLAGVGRESRRPMGRD